MRQVRDTLDRWIWEMIGIVLARWPPSGNQTWHVLQLCRCSVTPFEIAIPFYALSLFTCLTVWEMGMGLKFLGPQKRMVSDFRTFQIQFGMTSHVESWYVVMTHGSSGPCSESWGSAEGHSTADFGQSSGLNILPKEPKEQCRPWLESSILKTLRFKMLDVFWRFMFFKNQRISEPPFYRPTGGEILQ